MGNKTSIKWKRREESESESGWTGHTLSFCRPEFVSCSRPRVKSDIEVMFRK